MQSSEINDTIFKDTLISFAKLNSNNTSDFINDFGKKLDLAFKADEFDFAPLIEIVKPVDTLLSGVLNVLGNMIASIEALDNKSDTNTQRIKHIYKDKERYLASYIKSFDSCIEICKITGDKELLKKVEMHKNIFELFSGDPNECFMAFAKTTERRDVIKLSVLKYGHLIGRVPIVGEIYKKYKIDEIEYVLSVQKFFDGYGVTEKLLLKSSAIKIYKIYQLSIFKDIKHKKLKELIDTLFISTGYKVAINLDKIDNIYAKTVFKGHVIYSYKSKDFTHSRVGYDKQIEFLIKLAKKYGNEKNMGAMDKVFSKLHQQKIASFLH